MTDRRFIIEFGMGNDLHGADYTKAAIRAVESALHRSSLPLLGLPGIDRAALRVKVTIGVQDPGAVDVAAIAAHLPHAAPEITVTHGGLDSRHPGPGPGSENVIVIASAGIEAFLPPQTDRYRPAGRG